jgi:hypothetical protein
MVNVLLVIISIATFIGILGVWVPDFWKTDIGPKLFFTFVVLAVGISLSTGVLKFLNSSQAQIEQTQDK